MIKVLKFGGSSVADAVAMQRVIAHIRSMRRASNLPHTASTPSDPPNQLVIVVSALAQVTNQLTALVWERRNSGVINYLQLQAMQRRHQTIVRELLIALAQNHSLAAPASSYSQTCSQIAKQLEHWLEQIFTELTQCLTDLAPTASTPIAQNQLAASQSQQDPTALFAQQMARILAHGELLSSTILHLALRVAGLPNTWLDSSDLIITNQCWLQATPDLAATQQQVTRLLQPALQRDGLVVVPGFMAGTAAGQITLLGREGSDYSAALLAEALHADQIQIWSDVDGIFAVDPRYCSATTTPLPYLSYDQAGELATWGGKILYPSTVAPAKRANIPIAMLNSFQPAVATSTAASVGTYITNRANPDLWAVCGLVHPLILINNGTLTKSALRTIITVLNDHNIEFRGMFPLQGRWLLIAKDHHRPQGDGQYADYAWLSQELRLELNLALQLVAVIAAPTKLAAAEQALSALPDTYLLPTIGLGLQHSRVALMTNPTADLTQILNHLYQVGENIIN